MTDALSHVLFGHKDERELLNLKFLKGEKSCSVGEFRDTAANLIQGVETGLLKPRSEFGDKNISRHNVKEIVERL